ncbi:MAG: hypothetical protein K8R02_05565 [Anaerohalosphaeraceae bacterium]|nr:hypothetical protein [Anaerohalosphaeraceae bacterium]
MNTKTFFPMAIVLVAVFGMLVTVAGAGIIYETDFEAPTFTAGDIDGQDSWVVEHTTGIISDANDDPCYVIAGVQTLNVEKDGGTAIVYRDFTAQTGKVIIEFDAKLAINNKRARIKVLNGTDEICVMGFGSHDFFAVGDGGAGNVTQYLGSWSANTVYAITVVADIATQRYDFIVDGDTLADDYYFSSTVTQLDRLRYEGPDGGATFAVDDLVINDGIPGVGVPSPADDAEGIPFAVTLSWQGTGIADPCGPTYDVYFGTSATPPLVSSGQEEETYDVSGLGMGTPHYWRIDIIDPNFGGTPVTYTGDVWDFTTIGYKAWGPNPGRNTTDIVYTEVLSWGAGYGFDGGTGDLHKVYFGTSQALVTSRDASVFIGNQTGNTYDPDLDVETQYYWCIDEVIDSTTYSGDVWIFTTESPICVPRLQGDLNGDCVINFKDFAAMASEWLVDTTL